MGNCTFYVGLLRVFDELNGDSPRGDTVLPKLDNGTVFTGAALTG